MKNLFKILTVFFIVIGINSCTIKNDNSEATYMNDSTLTDVQKRNLALDDHKKINPILFEMIYDNNEVPSIVDDFSKLNVIGMSYDSMKYIIVKSKYGGDDHFEIINITLEKAMLEYYKNTSVIKAEQIRTNEESKSLYGTDITKGYFDREN